MKKIFVILSTLIMCVSLAACSDKEQSKDSSEISLVDSYELVEPEEHGTSEYVDYLSLKAKLDAPSASDEDLQYAFSWLKLKVTTGDMFSSQEIMERAMYNGELLDWHYSDAEGEEKNYAKIGWQAFKTVKYVYRGIDSAGDDETVRSLKKLTDLLDSSDDIVWRN